MHSYQNKITVKLSIYSFDKSRSERMLGEFFAYSSFYSKLCPFLSYFFDQIQKEFISVCLSLKKLFFNFQEQFKLFQD